MNDMQMAVDLGREALWIAVKLALPVLAVGLLVGFVISVLQAATQVQEQTLSFIPKMFAMVLTLFALLPWMVGVLVDYARELITDMGRWM